MGECCSDCLRCIFYIANLFYVLAGLSFIGAGTVAHVGAKRIHEYWAQDDRMKQAPEAHISLGVFLLLLGIFGYAVWCNCERNCRWQTVYVFMVGALLVITLVVSACVLNLSNDVDYKVKRVMKQRQATYVSSNVSRKYWDDFQTNNDCCGVLNRTDWLEYQPAVPVSCCHEYPERLPNAKNSEPPNPACKQANDKRPFLRYKGCLQRTVEMRRTYQTYMIISAGCSCGAQAVCFVTSVILMSSLSVGSKGPRNRAAPQQP